ncbi:MAG: exodeoxyribonuclease V subunit gamma [Anaerolineae bacterium]|nr:exodeoxyribonuclease V subunit gamma [Anaerolineae bacterium]
MATTVIQAQMGGGKTAAALQRIQSVLATSEMRMPRIWVLLASRRQEFAFRERMMAELSPANAVFFNVEFFNFYQLNSRLLNLAGQPPFRINESARMGVLRRVVDQLVQQGSLQVYDRIAGTSGFLRAIAALIDELKQNRVYPEQFQNAAQNAKDHDLARIYAAYQTMLQQHHLADREGEGWLALEAVEKMPTLASNLDLLLVDGYDQFTPVQAELVAELSRQVKHTVVTLTALSDKATRVGLRFQYALDQLKHSHEERGLPINTEIISSASAMVRAADLNHLSKSLFALDGTQPSSGAVQLIEAPEPAEETAAVLRAVKSLLVTDQAEPDDILVVVRDWPRYQAHIATYTQLFGLPVLRHQGQSIAQNPVIVTLMRLLQLADGPYDADQPDKGFRRRDVVDLLRSPYLRVPGFADDASIDLLDRVSRENHVLSGRDEWDVATEPEQVAPYDRDEEADDEQVERDFAQLSTISVDLETFFDAVTPPASGTLEQFVAWVDGLIGPDSLDDGDADEAYDEDKPESLDFSMIACIREGQEAHTVQRDLTAISTFKQILRGFLETELLLQSIGGASDEQTWQAFFADLQLAIKNAAPENGSTSRSGRVLIASATEARGLPHKHVFIMGMAEGVFPMPVHEDTFYLDSERLALRDRGVLLKTGSERSDDDGLFYELINLAQQTLTLSRPTVRDGKNWNPSHLWRHVLDAFDANTLPLTRYGVGEVVPGQSVASSDEALLAAIADEQAMGLRAFLLSDQPELWAHVMHNIAIEQGRMSRQSHDVFTGKITHPDLIADVQSQLGPNRRWSASQLNEYGACAFRFFAKRMLRLEALEEEEEGLDALQLGSLNHAILEGTYRQLMQDDIAISPDEDALQEALLILEEIAEEQFALAPKHYNFRPTARWSQEQQVILRRLRLMLQLDFSDKAPLFTENLQRMPYEMELRFGFPDTENITISVDDEESIFVRGAIDRIDRIGDKLYVIDYKTGSTKIDTKEMEAGRNFQMMLYLLALDAILKQRGIDNLQVGGGFFWHIRNQTDSGKLDISATVIDQPEIASARVHLARHLRNARKADFRVRPPKQEKGRCTSYCDYYQLCRLSVINQRKYD